MLSNIPHSQKLIVMLGVMLALLLAALDSTIVATAMPKIVADLQGLEHLSWVFTSYMLASTVIVPIYGKLSDIYGRKLFIILAVVIFLVGSILSGASQNMTQLIVFRGLQGLGGGAIFANAFATVGDLFPPAERGRWQGLLGAAFGLASVIGPTLGGWISDNASWRWVFYINIPVGIAALGVIWFLMPKIVPDIKNKSIDFLGAFFLAASLVSLLLALVWGGNQYAWDSFEIIALLTLATVSLISFIFVENKVSEPVLPLSLFKNPIFSVASLITFLTGIGMFGAILYVPLFAQLVLGVSATNSGTILTPLMLSMVVSSVISGQIMSRTGRYKWLGVLGMGLAASGMYLLSRMSAATTQMDLIERMVLTGAGIGISFPIFALAVQNAFDHSKLGVVTASTQLFRSIGATVGTAILGGMLNSSLTSKFSELGNDPFVQTAKSINPAFDFSEINVNQLQGLLTGAGREAIEKQISALPISVQGPATAAFSNFLEKTKEIFASSVSDIFFVAAITMLLAFLVSLMLQEKPLRQSHETDRVEEAGKELAVEEGILPAKDEPQLE